MYTALIQVLKNKMKIIMDINQTNHDFSNENKNDLGLLYKMCYYVRMFLLSTVITDFECMWSKVFEMYCTCVKS